MIVVTTCARWPRPGRSYGGAGFQVQSLRRPSPGGPVDNQIGGYLLDCELVVTADRVFAECLDQVRPAAPFTFADVAVVPGTPEDAAKATIARLEGLAT